MFFLVILLVIGVAAIGATIHALVSDGYGRIATHPDPARNNRERSI